MTRIHTLSAIALLGLVACGSDINIEVPEGAIEAAPATDVTDDLAVVDDGTAPTALEACSLDGRKLERVWERQTAAGEDSLFATSYVSDTVAIASPYGILEIWTTNPQDNLEIHSPELRIETGLNVRSMSFSADGNYLTLSTTLGVEVWDITVGERVALAANPGAPANAVASQKRSFEIRMASAWDETIRVTSDAAQTVSEMDSALDSTRKIGFWNESQHVITAGEVDGIAAVAIYPQGAETALATLPIAGSTESFVQLQDGRYVFAGETDGEGFVAMADISAPNKPRFTDLAIAERPVEAIYELNHSVLTFGEGRAELWDSRSLESLGGFDLGNAVFATVDPQDQSILAIYADGSQRQFACES